MLLGEWHNTPENIAHFRPFGHVVRCFLQYLSLLSILCTSKYIYYLILHFCCQKRCENTMFLQSAIVKCIFLSRISNPICICICMDSPRAPQLKGGPKAVYFGSLFSGVVQHIASYILHASTYLHADCISTSNEYSISTRWMCHVCPKITLLYADRCHRKSEIFQFCQIVRNLPQVGEKVCYIVELKWLVIEHKLFLL